MQNRHSEIIIEIDAEVEQLLHEINAAPRELQYSDFINAFQKMMIDQLIGPFGLSQAMFDDRDGGAITTVKNFEDGIVANDADRERHENWMNAQKEVFDATDYNKQHPAERKTAFKKEEKIFDEYTNAELPKDGRAVRDHIVSAHEIEKSSRGHLSQTREERVTTANQPENKAWTSKSLNSSKGDLDFLDWAELPSRKDPTKTNRESFGGDERLMAEKYKRARHAVDTEQKDAVFEKQMSELVTEGAISAGKLAVRQVLGLLLKDLIEGLVQDVRHLMRVGIDDMKALAEMVQARIRRTYEKVCVKWSEYLKEGVSAGLSGFLSNLVTLIINAVITTVKNVVRIIREAVLSIVRAIKVVVAPPSGINGEEKTIEALKILSSSVAACVGIALEEMIAKAMQSVPLLAPFATTVAPIIAGIVSGTMTLLTVLAFDRLRNNMAFRNKQIANIHRGQASGFLRIKQAVLILDAAHNYLAVSSLALNTQFSQGEMDIGKERNATRMDMSKFSNSVDLLDDILGKLDE
jgi:hypothetical protein